MKITRHQLRRIIREAEGSTKKYDDDSALKGDQSKLPDELQKGIIDKTVEDREEREKEEREEKNESLRITRRQLRRIIRESINEKHKVGGGIPRDFSNPGQAPLEITDKGVTRAQVSKHWPNVVYRGQDVMDLMYDDMTINSAQDALEDMTGTDFEGQEAYLGWDPDSDVFVMGFDVWEDHGMAAGIVTLDPRGRVLKADIKGNGMYPSGRRIISKQHPNILELRLD